MVESAADETLSEEKKMPARKLKSNGRTTSSKDSSGALPDQLIPHP